MRRSSADSYKTVLEMLEEPINEMIANMLCDLEDELYHEHVPSNFENVLDATIDYLRNYR